MVERGVLGFPKHNLAPSQNTLVGTTAFQPVSYTHLDVYKRQAMTCCMVIANRRSHEANTGYKNTIDSLIKLVLERI